VDTGGIADYAFLAWRYEDAIRRGDQLAARQARGDFWTHDAESGSARSRDSSGYALTASALEAGDLSGAADHLLHWLDVSQADGDDAERQNCKTALSAVVAFFDEPASFAQPHAAAIKNRAMALAVEAQDYLAHPTIVGLERLQSR
jgi:hypothetical protein